jgi:RNA polymerase sigma-70 factor, ECF subfamily
MFEGKRVVAGEAILNRTASMDRSGTNGSRAASVEQIIASLVGEYSRMVYRIAYAVLHSHHDAEDATQETFLRVLRYSSRLTRVENPKTWLARISWRVAIDRSRQQKRPRDLSLDDPAEPVEHWVATGISADEAAHGAQFQAALERLMRSLPEKLRLPLILSAIEEMSPREVAETLDINEAAVRSRVFRARQILKEKLAQHERRK